jgi:hypothetical protein
VFWGPCGPFSLNFAPFTAQIIEKNVSGKKDGRPERCRNPRQHPSQPPTHLSVRRRTLYPTKNKSSETAEITGKLREKYNWFGINDLAWSEASEGVDRRGASQQVSELTGQRAEGVAPGCQGLIPGLAGWVPSGTTKAVLCLARVDATYMLDRLFPASFKSPDNMNSSSILWGNIRQRSNVSPFAFLKLIG